MGNENFKFNINNEKKMKNNYFKNLNFFFKINGSYLMNLIQ